MAGVPRLTAVQDEQIREYFPEEQLPDERPGRKLAPTRAVLEAVLWMLNGGARLRRYQCRRIVERIFAWLPWKRRSLGRRAHDAANVLGFVHLACLTILLRPC
jgi:hypothetical protein